MGEPTRVHSSATGADRYLQVHQDGMGGVFFRAGYLDKATGEETGCNVPIRISHEDTAKLIYAMAGALMERGEEETLANTMHLIDREFFGLTEADAVANGDKYPEKMSDDPEREAFITNLLGEEG